MAGRGGADRDQGTSLVEVLVAMSVFMVVLSVVLATIVSNTRTAAETSAGSDLTSEARRAYQLLDRQVRYADAVNAPGLAGDAYWVELRTLPATATAAVCVQWRYGTTTGQLQFRTWAATATAPDTWTTVLTTDAAHAGTDSPFTVTAATGETMPNQKLTVRMTGARHGSSTAALEATFVARNTTPSSLGNVVRGGVSTAPVCVGSTGLAGVRA